MWDNQPEFSLRCLELLIFFHLRPKNSQYLTMLFIDFLNWASSSNNKSPVSRRFEFGLCVRAISSLDLDSQPMRIARFERTNDLPQMGHLNIAIKYREEYLRHGKGAAHA